MARVCTSSILIVLALASAACGGGDGGDSSTPTPIPPHLTVRFVLPAASAPDPFPAGISRFVVTLQQEDGTVVVSEEFTATEPLSIPGVDPIEDVILVLEGFDASDVLLSRGRTLVFDLTDQDAEVSMYFARVHEFNDVSGPYSPRAAQSVARLSDGRVLIAGGIGIGSATPLTNAEIYDPVTDTLTATASLGTALAFPAAVSLRQDVLLLAGGLDSSGDESRVAQVYVYDPIAHAGNWMPGVDRMIEARADHGAARLDSNEALVMGGREADGLPSSSWETFTWDGGTGAWTSGTDLSEEHLGAIAISVDGDEAFAGGGFEDDVTVFAIQESYVFDATSVGSPTDLVSSRGWPGVVQIDDDEWLLLGGLGGTSPGVALSSTERVRWTGSAATHSAPDDPLPGVARRRGGGGKMAHGEIVVLGGDTSVDGAAPAAVDAAHVFDPVAGTFTAFGKSPGATVAASVIPLPDGTTLVVTDGKVTRYNPRP